MKTRGQLARELHCARNRASLLKRKLENERHKPDTVRRVTQTSPMPTTNETGTQTGFLLTLPYNTVDVEPQDKPIVTFRTMLVGSLQTREILIVKSPTTTDKYVYRFLREATRGLVKPGEVFQGFLVATTNRSNPYFVFGMPNDILKLIMEYRPPQVEVLSEPRDDGPPASSIPC